MKKPLTAGREGGKSELRSEHARPLASPPPLLLFGRSQNTCAPAARRKEDTRELCARGGRAAQRKSEPRGCSRRRRDSFTRVLGPDGAAPRPANHPRRTRDLLTCLPTLHIQSRPPSFAGYVTHFFRSSVCLKWLEFL